LSPALIKQLFSKYHIALLSNIVESARLARCYDNVVCDSMSLVIDDDKELFSSKKIDNFKDPSLKLFLIDEDKLECYLHYRFTICMDNTAVYNNILLVFRIAHLDIQQIMNKILRWIITPEQTLRYFYFQNS
jgi:hypothetical protein